MHRSVTQQCRSTSHKAATVGRDDPARGDRVWWGSARPTVAALWRSRVACGAILFGMAATAAAQRVELSPDGLDEVGVTEHLDAQLPLDLAFVDCDGNDVTLGDVFDGERPVILTMNYSDCPRLCILQLEGLVAAIEKMDWDLGDQYEIVTVSIDPLETPERARLTKQKYMQEYNRAGTAHGWHFFISHKEENIKELARTVGFGYRYDRDSKQFAHAAVAMICTPDGRVSRYLYGVTYDPQTLKFSMLEAGEGKIGTTVEHILLYCFHYDSSKGRYGPHAMRLMQFGAAFTVLILGGILSIYWIRERRKAGAESPGDQSSDEQGGETSP